MGRKRNDPSILSGSVLLCVIIGFCLLTLTWSQKHQAASELENLDEQIQALSDYVFEQRTTMKLPPPDGMANRTGFPDMNIFTQLYEAVGDELKAEGICSACQVGIGFLMHMVRVQVIPLKDFQDVTTFICTLFKIATPEVCSGIIERNAPTFHFIFKERPLLTPKIFCGIMLQSFGCTTYDPRVEWSVDIPTKYKNKLKDVNDNRLNGIQPPRKPRDNSGRIKILQLSDLHIDPLYEPGSNAVCENKILCCQGSQGRPLNKSLQAGYYGDPRKCDTPYHTLDLALEQMAKEHPDAKLFYMTGDIVPHNIWSTSEADNTKIIQQTAAYIYKYFPNITLIPVLGNHETHPVNYYTPMGIPEELSTRWIYNTTFEAYKQWIPPNQAELYLKAGYYAVEVDDKFRILVINSNFCYGFNVWQTYEFGDTYGHLAWLIQQLQLTESQKKTAHIVGHVPPGHDECSRVWSQNFYKILLRYHHIIKGQFYGHTHYGEFKLFYDLTRRPINTIWIAPSLTPYEVNHLAYRVYYADPNDYEILDHVTWMFNLRTANARPDQKPKWTNVSSGSVDYGIPDTSPMSMDILVNKLATDERIFQKFYQNYHKVFEGEERKKCSTRCRKRILCGIVRSYFGEEANCVRIQLKVDGIVLPVKDLNNRG